MLFYSLFDDKVGILVWKHKYYFNDDNKFDISIYYDPTTDKVGGDLSYMDVTKVSSPCFSKEEMQSFAAKLSMTGARLLPKNDVKVYGNLADFAMIEVYRISNFITYIAYNAKTDSACIILEIANMKVSNATTLGHDCLVLDYRIWGRQYEMSSNFMLINCNISVLMLMVMSANFRQNVLGLITFSASAFTYNEPDVRFESNKCTINALKGIEYNLC